MKKMTRAFQLDPMTEPVTIKLNPEDKKWYPQTHFYKDKNEIFIYGEGWKKTGKWKNQIIQPLPNPYTAESLKAVKDEYGLTASMGMIHGWNNSSLFDDRSCGLVSTKYEVANMTDLGKRYDEFTNKVQAIGDHFIEGLLKKGFSIQGTINKCSLWYDYKSPNDCGQLVGSIGIYETIHLHPLQHIEHVVGASIFSARILPQFNPITFDKMLVELFMSKYHLPDCDFSKSNKMLKKYVSVYDRIKHLTNKKIADEIKSIFELQKETNHV